jgi:hypothetical protein
MLNAVSVRPAAVVAFGVMCVVCSKIWLPLNFVGMNAQTANIHDGSYTAYPLQYYFMNHGPWMSWTSYAVQSAAVLVCGGVMWWILSASFTKNVADTTSRV